MSTSFNLSITSQSTLYFENKKRSTCKSFIEFSKTHTKTARFIGLPIAVCFSLLDLSEAVAVVGESFIKGIANAPFSKKCNFLKGIKQIFLQFPVHLFNGVIGIPFGIAFEIFVTPIKMLESPESALEERKEKIEFIDSALDIISNKKPYQTEYSISGKTIRFNMLVTKHLYT